MGHFVIVAENGIDAIRLFKDNDFDIILMDYQMPVMDGVETTSKIREIEAKKENSVRTPIIVVSGNLNNEVKELFIKADVDDFIAKPLGKDMLLKAINKFT